jgi:thiamine biosynthesis protein ThiS
MLVNGERKTIEGKVALLGFLEQEGYDMERVAVEKNGRIVPKSAFATETLSDADVMEIVAFVGGG